MPSLASLLDSYLAGPQAVRKAVSGMTAAQLTARPVAGKWSTLEVVCHLVDSEQAWTHRMKRVIAEQRPLFIGYDESLFARNLGYHQRDLEEELSLLESTRVQMARILRALPSESLERDGVHNERGLMTLAEMIEIEADHITHHLRFVGEKRKALGLPE